MKSSLKIKNPLITLLFIIMTAPILSYAATAKISFKLPSPTSSDLSIAITEKNCNLTTTPTLPFTIEEGNFSTQNISITPSKTPCMIKFGMTTNTDGPYTPPSTTIGTLSFQSGDACKGSLQSSDKVCAKIEIQDSSYTPTINGKNIEFSTPFPPSLVPESS